MSVVSEIGHSYDPIKPAYNKGPPCAETSEPARTSETRAVERTPRIVIEWGTDSPNEILAPGSRHSW